jgi:O-acetyl-ADP-ribose deacetylase (regulator of RNase III)
MKYIDGDLIALSFTHSFDVIAHGCNCFNIQNAGIARKMDKRFKTLEFDLEKKKHFGDPDKLGRIDFRRFRLPFRSLRTLDMPWGESGESMVIVNAYTQYRPGPNADLNAIRMVMWKINMMFQGLRIGLPKIGCGIGGLDWEDVSKVIEEELVDMDVTIVNYKK